MTKDCREETTIILIFEWRNDFTARYTACYTRWANHEKMDSHSNFQNSRNAESIYAKKGEKIWTLSQADYFGK